MSWYAKPRGAYDINSLEAKANMEEIYNLLKDTWTLEAISGMIGNFVSESGLNPWRWQSDSVSQDSKKGYGLAQFTPAWKTDEHGGYIEGYGVGVAGYSPNKSVSVQEPSATPYDGMAQIIVIDTDKAGKFLDRRNRCTYANLSDTFPYSKFKQLNDLWLTTVGWLFNYEYPDSASRTYDKAVDRYNNSLVAYNYLSGLQPTPPTPPTPPQPVPPRPLKKKMPLYMYIRRY